MRNQRKRNERASERRQLEPTRAVDPSVRPGLRMGNGDPWGLGQSMPAKCCSAAPSDSSHPADQELGATKEVRAGAENALEMGEMPAHLRSSRGSRAGGEEPGVQGRLARRASQSWPSPRTLAFSLKGGSPHMSVAVGRTCCKIVLSLVGTGSEALSAGPGRVRRRGRGWRMLRPRWCGPCEVVPAASQLQHTMAPAPPDKPFTFTTLRSVR